MIVTRPRIESGRIFVPGLMNAHSHSFQRTIRGRTERPTGAGRDTFWTWREAMYRAANRLSPEDIYHVARMAFLEMVLTGITTVREFQYLHNAPDGSRYGDPNLLSLQIIQAAQEVGLRIILLQTAYARAGFEKPPNPLQARFITPAVDTFLADTERLSVSGLATVGIALHSIRALPLDYIREAIKYARSKNMQVDMHIAEQPAEVEACLAEHGRRPVEVLQDNGVLDSRFTAVHAIHITQEEIGFLGAARSAVCACPTTERNLGDGPVPADRFVKSGVRICLGSDSNAQIGILEDARSLEYHLRMTNLERAILAPEQLLDATTADLGAGHSGDFFTLDLNDPSLAGADEASLVAQIVFSAERTAVRDVVVNGRKIVQDGHHALESEIIHKFAEVQRRLWA
jgi:formimidoylglutamate deiminase